MSSMFLDSGEIRELTNRIQHASQAKVLRAMGIEHRARPDGSIAVLRAHVEQVFGARSTDDKPRKLKREHTELA